MGLNSGFKGLKNRSDLFNLCYFGPNNLNYVGHINQFFRLKYLVCCPFLRPGQPLHRLSPLSYALGCLHLQDRRLVGSSETSLTANRTAQGVETGKITIHVLTVLRYSNFK